MSRRRQPGLVYTALKHTVLALDRATGAELWRTRLPKVRFRTNDFVGLTLDGDALFAASAGEVFCLDAANGALRWQNSLTGLGVGVVSVLPAPASAGPAATATPTPTVAQILAARKQSS